MTQASQKVIRDILTKLTSQPFVIGGVSAKNFVFKFFKMHERKHHTIISN